MNASRLRPRPPLSAFARPARWRAAVGLVLALTILPVGRAIAAPLFAADFVSTAASGSALNDAGDVTGTSYPDPGCGPWCLPTLETVVWRGGTRIVLPSLPGYSGITVRGINNAGWIVGYAGLNGTTTRAVVWKPSGSTYQVFDLGLLPGTTTADAVGIDESGRVIGQCTTLFFPPTPATFVWTEAGGMVNVSTLGFPADRPLAISPGGTVTTASAWYNLGVPGVVTQIAPAPNGYMNGTYPTAINDAGDQARFLVSTSSQNLVYLFRYHHEGVWQQVSTTGTGNLTPYGVGSINAAGDLTATVAGSAVIAFGPDGLTQSLGGLLSPAYAGSTVTVGGPLNAAGQILAQVMIGRSPRLMKLTPASACTANCIRISSMLVSSRFVQDRRFPGECFQGGKMYNQARADLTVTSEAGTPLSGVTVTGHILDDYWTDKKVTGITNAQGKVVFTYKGQCGVGALAFLADGATLSPRTLDRTVGVLTGYSIPKAVPDGPSATASGDGFEALDSPGLEVLALGAGVPGRAALRYTLPRDCHATVRVYRGDGAEVATLVDRDDTAGSHTVSWSGVPRGASRVVPGVYWARVEACGMVESARLLVYR